MQWACAKNFITDPRGGDAHTSRTVHGTGQPPRAPRAERRVCPATGCTPRAKQAGAHDFYYVALAATRSQTVRNILCALVR